MNSDRTECSIYHAVWWRKWSGDSFFHKLLSAHQRFVRGSRASRLTPEQLTNRSGWQKRATLLFKCPIGTSVTHFRKKLDKWTTLTTLPGHWPGRVCRLLCMLGTHATPRVQAAYMRTIFNGWCTRGRFQQIGACRFGCGHGVDKIEHFPMCPVVKTLLASTGTWHGTHGVTPLDSFLCMDVGSSHVELASFSIGRHSLAFTSSRCLKIGFGNCNGFELHG